MREGDYHLARENYPQARVVLQALESVELPADAQAVVLHNIAYTYFCEKSFAKCIELLAPSLAAQPQASGSAIASSDAQVGLQRLWLRALHHSKDVARACDWAKQTDEAGGLSPRVAGIASLVALDASEAHLALKWARSALEHDIKDSERSEAYVTWASLALGNQDIKQALEFSDRALALNPGEGRAWSIKAFAQLLGGALVESQQLFAKALQASPEHIGTWHGLGWAQLVAGSTTDALKTFQHVLEMDRNFAESQGAVAVALFLTGDLEGAKKHADNAHGLDKTSLAGQYARALISGEVQGTEALQRLARRILGSRKALLGGSMADWLDKP